MLTRKPAMSLTKAIKGVLIVPLEFFQDFSEIIDSCLVSMALLIELFPVLLLQRLDLFPVFLLLGSKNYYELFLHFADGIVDRIIQLVNMFNHLRLWVFTFCLLTLFRRPSGDIH